MLLKVYTKKVISIVVASSLIFGVGNAITSAAPKNDVKDTGRTEQNVQTGVISFDDITVPRYAQEILLTGTVIIDGPQLVVTIPGSKSIKVTEIGNKTWKYEATVDVTAIKGDKEIEISAYTIYKNGQHAGSIHTSAKTKNQKIHVPYVISTVAENTKWTSYNRSINQFTLSYNEVQNWSVGDPVITAKTEKVNGVESEVTVLGTTLEVPTAFQNFVFSQEDPIWEYDTNTQTYIANFNILITDSKGNITTKSVTKTGLVPGIINKFDVSLEDDFGTITNDHELKAPDAPVVQVTPVELKDLQVTIERQNRNQFKVKATYTIVYSDNSEEKVKDQLLEGGTIADPESQNQNSSSKVYEINKFKYNITVNYDASTKNYYVTAVLIN